MRARSMSLSKLWHSYVVHLRNEVFLLQRMEDQNLKNQALNQYNILSEGLRALLCVCVHAKRGIENATAIILRLLLLLVKIDHHHWLVATRPTIWHTAVLL